MRRNPLNPATLVATYGKRHLAEWLADVDSERLRYKAALQEIARWDEFKTIGYEGPKRVAESALHCEGVAA